MSDPLWKENEASSFAAVAAASKDGSEAGWMQLECGSSLAEGEFLTVAITTAMTMTTNTDDDCNNNSSSNENGQTKIQNQLRNNKKSHCKSIQEFRNAIAQDVLVTTSSSLFSSSFSMFSSPFEIPGKPGGLKVPLVYCDHTASNRSCASLERYIAQKCLPWYANTHTNTSMTGSQSTAFTAEARQIVAEATNSKITGKASLDVVLFCGQGATSAVELLIDCLGLRHAATIAETKPVVFVGPYEHHSNLVPWREAGMQVVMVPECPVHRQVDLQALEHLLQQYQHQDKPQRLKMGTFSAASNVTGKLSDTNAIAALLHKYGCLAFFDYATAAPYASSSSSDVQLNMNPTPTSQYPDAAMIAKDAIFFSPHKLWGGGAGTPGVLCVKKHLVSQVNAPSRSGGGTVFYVTNDHHRFLSNRVERYEGGTPHICGIIRVGLCFLWKRRVEQEYHALATAEAATQQQQRGEAKELENNNTSQSTEIPLTIQHFDLQTYQKVAAYLKEHAPKLVLLGYDDVDDDKNNNNAQPHLPIFSFLIRFDRNRFLHYNYICAVLNDLFGIQTRGGCQCAGPYSQRLLGLTTADNKPNDKNRALEQALVQHKERAELLRPGYTRLSLPFKGLSSLELDYVLKALVWVSEHAWALMCQYRCNHRTGEWRHASRQGKPLGKERRWLSHYQPFGEKDCADVLGEQQAAMTEKPTLEQVLEQTLEQADQVLAAAIVDQRSIAQALKMADADSVLGADNGVSAVGESESLEALRWYAYPKECAIRLKGNKSDFSSSVEKNEILGAINPFLSTTGKLTLTILQDTEMDQSDRKRKMRSTVMAFRDGEHHQGEAELAEIEEGIEDGELSENTEVFDNHLGDWVNAVKYLLLGGNKAKLADDSRPKESVEQGRIFQKKKGPRDQSCWGHGHVASVASESAKVKSCSSANNKKPAAPVQKKGKKKQTKHVIPPPKLMRLVIQAVHQWEMIKDGDRLLLGLSGGKDSLSLLHCLLELQRRLPAKFELEVCTIDPMTPSFDPSPLIPYVESLGLKYHYVKDDIVARAASAGKDGKTVSSLCAFCARMKRGNLYNVARENKCNKLVLAQHLDDCAESFMMSVMHNGLLRTMKANYEIDAGDLSVIRPLAYCRESLMTDFAKSANLPVINENCPACFEEPKERARVKKLLSREEMNYNNLYDNMRRSLLPLMHPYAESVMHSFTEETVARSRKKPHREDDKNADSDKPATSGTGTNVESRSDDGPISAKQLCDFTDEDLIVELARRKSVRSRSVKALESSSRTAQMLSGSPKMLCEVGGACSHFD